MPTKALLLVAALLAFESQAFAQSAPSRVVFDNGLPAHTDSNNVAYFIGAEDFTFDTDQQIGGIQIWLHGNSGYAGVIDWAIYTDAGGSPGAVLSSGGSSATFKATGYVWPDGTPEYRMDFQFTPFKASANTRYWFGFRNGVPDPSNWPDHIPPFNWEWTSPNNSLTSYFYGYGCCGAPTCVFR